MHTRQIISFRALLAALLLAMALISPRARAEPTATTRSTTQPMTISAPPHELIVIPDHPTTKPSSRIAFVVDASGTMLGLKLKLLQRELGTAIKALDPAAQFTIVVYKGGDSDAEWVQPFSGVLKPASDDNKSKAINFVRQMKAEGRGTNPLPALRLAFRQGPELIYFLTDGEFNNVVTYERVIEEVRQLNASKGIRLNTIAFMSEDEQAEGVLSQLAREHRGRFMKVTDRDLRATTQPTTAPIDQ